MFLSPAEFFILGRIAAAWPVRERLLTQINMGPSLMRIIDRVFDDFGLQRARPPEGWWDRTDDLPRDVAWRDCVNTTRTNEFMSTTEGFPGIPSVAMGLSPSEKGTLFVERSDGRICGWRIEPPRSGLYGILMRRLRSLMGLSPQLWVMFHDATWPTVVDEWRNLTDARLDYPQAPFMPDPPGDVASVLETAAEEGDSLEPFGLGKTTGAVDYELEEQAAIAGFRPTLLKFFGRWRQPPDEVILVAFQRAKETMRSPEAAEATRSDLHVAALYHMAEQELLGYEGEIYDLQVLTLAIVLAHERTHRGSAYLYGKLHAMCY